MAYLYRTMARKPRIQFEGAIYHVVFRGIDRRVIFQNDKDRIRMLESLGERVEQYGVRLYLYCLMSNHVHLLIETPRANLSTFMSSLLTSYCTYFNRRYQRSGHLTEARFKSPLVEGDQYLLKLSRYIHLNPVFVDDVKDLSLEERQAYLNAYRWSSYRSYIELEKRKEFMSYQPVLNMVDAKGAAQIKRYRNFVESGMASTDDEFISLLKQSTFAIGSESFLEEMKMRCDDSQHEGRDTKDDGFRRIEKTVPASVLLEGVCRHFNIDQSAIRTRRKNDNIKPVAAFLLVRYGGMSQKAAADVLNLRTGASVCHHLKKIRESKELQNHVSEITSKLTI